MTRREFLELMGEVEAEFPVASWKVRGIHAWPLIRLSLYSATFRSGSPEHSLGAGWRRMSSNVRRGLWAWARASLADREANRRPWEPADAVFLGSSIGRRPLLEGRRYDVRAGPYVDLLSELGARPLVWETSPFGDYNVPRHTPSFFLQPHLIAQRAASQLLPVHDHPVELERYDEFVSRVQRRGLRFAHADLVRVRRDMRYVRRLADTFERWLRRSGPRLGFVAGTGLQEQAFCLACRELGITSVEVQHGVQGDFHPSYGSWFAVPREGWETRARVFWSWDEESAAAINRWAAAAPRHHVAVVGGDPWREMWDEGRGELIRRTEERIRGQLQATGARRHILVTVSSQGDVVPPALVQVIRSSPREWQYWFRLHPVNQAARCQEARRVLGPLGIEPRLLEFATEVPLHPLLRQVDCHLSVGLSTVITEAAALGVPSIACGPEAPDFYPAELASGMLVPATSAPEILEALGHLVARGRRPPAPEAPRAPGTMRRLLDRELSAGMLCEVR